MYLEGSGVEREEAQTLGLGELEGGQLVAIAELDPRVEHSGCGNLAVGRRVFAIVHLRLLAPHISISTGSS